MKNKSAKLVFRGFDAPVAELVSAMGIAPTRAANRGERLRPDRAALPRSFANFSLDFDEDTPIDQILPDLFEFLGGIDKITAVRQRFAPEYLSVELFLPATPCDIAREGFFPAAALRLLGGIDCDLGLNFFEVEALSGGVVLSPDPSEHSA